MIPSAHVAVRSTSVWRLARKSVSTASRGQAIPQRSLYQHHQRLQQALFNDTDNSSGISIKREKHSPVSSNAFDPPAQISKINTHYYREPQLVMIEGYGILQGQMDSSRLLTKYLNIPFATIQDKSKEAIKPEPWRGIRDATVLGPMCPQDVQSSNNLTTMMLGLPGPGFEFSERDCLNLNVFAPRLSQNMPVICYIHGGLSSGGNALPKNDATNIVKKSMAKNMPVVVVTINYRLLPSAGLLESSNNNDVKSKDGETFDWGIYDQKLALEWVKKHIHNFGGNPDEITLMGHSNGMSSPGYHLMNAKKEGLVKRAIMHSESKSRKSENEGDATRWSSKSFSETTELALARSARGNGTNIQFSFMSDTCMPYMSEAEKESGFRVIDRWIDFAWGNESSTGSNYNS